MFRHQPGPRAEARRGIEHRARQDPRSRASQEMHQCGKLGGRDRAAPGQAGEESLQVFGCPLRQGAGPEISRHWWRRGRWQRHPTSTCTATASVRQRRKEPASRGSSGCTVTGRLPRPARTAAGSSLPSTQVSAAFRRQVGIIRPSARARAAVVRSGEGRALSHRGRFADLPPSPKVGDMDLRFAVGRLADGQAHPDKLHIRLTATECAGDQNFPMMFRNTPWPS